MRIGWFSCMSMILILTIATSPTICAAAAAAGAPEHGSPIARQNIKNDRQAILQRLEKLGANPDQAARSVAMLNQDDLATLAANPRMIQRAGDTDSITREAFWGCVALGAVAAIIGLLAD